MTTLKNLTSTRRRTRRLVAVVLMDIHPAAEIAAEANDLLWAKTNGGFENESASILTARLMSNCVAHAVKEQMFISQAELWPLLHTVRKRIHLLLF